MAMDIERVLAVIDNDETLLTGDGEVKDRRLGYFYGLLNVESERQRI